MIYRSTYIPKIVSSSHTKVTHIVEQEAGVSPSPLGQNASNILKLCQTCKLYIFISWCNMMQLVSNWTTRKQKEHVVFLLAHVAERSARSARPTPLAQRSLGTGLEGLQGSPRSAAGSQTLHSLSVIQFLFLRAIIYPAHVD